MWPVKHTLHVTHTDQYCCYSPPLLMLMMLTMLMMLMMLMMLLLLVMVVLVVLLVVVLVLVLVCTMVLLLLLLAIDRSKTASSVGSVTPQWRPGDTQRATTRTVRQASNREGQSSEATSHGRSVGRSVGQ
jgi:hypothetical protein